MNFLTTPTPFRRTRWGVLVIAGLLFGCATPPTQLDQGKLLINQGNFEGAMDQLQQAMREAPENADARAAFTRAREGRINQLLNLAENARAGEDLITAEQYFRQAQRLDANNARVRGGLTAVESAMRHQQILQQVEQMLRDGHTDKAGYNLRQILAENPRNLRAQALMRNLDESRVRSEMETQLSAPKLKKTVSLEFRDAPLRSVFEVLSRHSGLNFIFDRDVRGDSKVTIFAKETTVEDAIKVILTTNQLERKILNENTVMIYPNSPVKLKDYQDLVLKTFYLANADVKQTANMIKTLVKTRDVFIDEKLGMLMIRDTPEAILVAEKLIAAQDLADPEVMLEVEVLEVGRSRLSELGIKFPDQIGFTMMGAGSSTTTTGTGTTTGTSTSVTSSGTPGQMSYREFRNANSDSIRVTVPSPTVTLNLKTSTGDVSTLANPRIRVRNREKAKVHIGEKVPVITTTTQPTGSITESVQYLDVGLKLDVEPTVYLENEIAMKLSLEVSSIVKEVKSASTGLLTYQIGSRTASTVLRLRDGETQVLAGLISRDERNTADRVPGLGDLPMVGRLFSSHKKDANETEIVLLVTPRVVRNLARPAAHLTEFLSGTDSLVGTTSLRLTGKGSLSVPPGANPDAGQPGVAPAVSGQPPGPAPDPAAPVNAAAPPPVALGVLAPANAAVDSDVAISVNIGAPTRINDVMVEVEYDPTKMRLLTVGEGGFMKQGEGQVTFNYQDNGGRIRITTNKPNGVQGEGALAGLNFKILAKDGESVRVSLSGAEIKDAAGAALPFQHSESSPIVITK